ncbi:MAG: hypothetical protein Q7K54_05815 [Candidatus Parcubacteria bacterium]|nr:hypothetical protein [Candidatus Parcubacteria bacterium]
MQQSHVHYCYFCNEITIANIHLKKSDDVLRRAIKDNRYVFVRSYCEPQDFKAMYNALRVCPSCWEVSAGEDWMFEK